MKIPVTVVIYPCEFGPDGTGLGPETIARLESFKTVLECPHYEVKAVILSAGLSPNVETSKKQKLSFAEMMRKWIVENTDFPQSQITSHRRVWGTVEETIAAAQIIRWHDLPTHVLAITSYYHVPRVRMCWWFVKDRDWKITMHNSPYPSPWWLEEKLRYLGAMWKILSGTHNVPTRLVECPKCGKRSVCPDTLDCLNCSY